MEEKPLKTSLKSILLRGCISASLALGALSLLPPSPVSAATIVVTETDDHLHGGTVGTCNSGVDCTLREAVALANASNLTPDTIVFASGLTSATITLNSTITVISPITITGPVSKLTITGSGIQLFITGDTLTMENLILSGGAGAPYGGAIYNQNGTLTVRNMSFLANQATDGFNGTGGAIYNSGSLTVEKCFFQGNVAAALPGGGAILNNSGPLTITNSTFTTNSALQGAAISLAGGSLSLTGSTLGSNSASSGGGGLYLAPSSSATIVNSTFYSNYGGFDGGAIYNRGTLNTNFSTIVNNRAVTNGSGIYTTGNATINNTIVALNADGATKNNCYGTIGAGSNNLTDDPTCGTVFTETTNTYVMGPADNGGDTLTYSLHALSPAIDAAASCIATDQRGMNRGATCDIGAYEYDGQPGLSINDVTVTEGNSGTTTAAFTVTLSAPALAGGVTFDIATADGTATTADSDYAAQNLTGQTIAAGSSTYTFNVTINGDTAPESDETFTVNITNVTGAMVTDGQGAGTISNDDVVTADVSVSVTDSPDPVLGGGNLSYTIDYANNGPSAASSVAITSTLAAGTTFASITTPSGWSCTTPAVGSGGTISCTNPSLANGASGTITMDVSVSAGVTDGTMISETVSISSSTVDPASGNDSASTTTTVHAIPVAITNAAGSVTWYTATLNGEVNPLGSAATAYFEYGPTVSYGTRVDITSPGSGTGFVPVSTNISGLSPAATYHYRLVAENSYGSIAGMDQTFSTTPLPNMTIDDVSQAEGNSGTSTYTFTVSLSSGAPTGGVSFNIRTEDDNATMADGDYITRTLTGVTIDEGEDTYTFNVTVIGDDKSETDEVFYVYLSNVTGAYLIDDQGQGTILNDDIVCSSAITVANNADSGPGSLRQAIADVCAGGTISFDSSMAGQTITLTSGQLAIGKSMTINGLTTSPGVSVSGNNAVRVFYISAGTVAINNLTIRNGLSVPAIPSNLGGAGIFIDTGSTVTVNNCAILNNATNASPTTGGGVVVNTGASLTINSSTISGNSSSFDGGGILNLGTLTVNSSTIVNNTAPGAGGGLETVNPATILRNTILAGNAGPLGPDCYTPVGTIQSSGYNLVGSTTNCTVSAGIGDVTGFSYASLLLGPLQDNGGPTSTYALLPGSPAIDAIPGCNSGPAADQRGITRPQGTACDVGAYETVGIPALSINDVTQTEGDSGSSTFTFTVSLSFAAPVTFDIATADNTATTASDYTNRSLTSQLISSGTTYTFDVTVNGDQAQETNETFFVNITNVTGATVTDGQGQGTITNDDTAGITISPTSGLTTTEAGGTATFTIVLNSQPTADVIIDLASSDTTEGTVSPASLTFTTANWTSPQTVTVTGVDDMITDGSVPYTIITAPAVSSDLSYSGMDVADVSVTNSDNDTVGFTVNPTSGLTTTEAGGTATFTIVLNSEPTADVTIDLSTSDTSEGTVSPASLTFTAGNWNIPQIAMVTGVDDDLVDGDIAYTIQTGPVSSADGLYSGLDPADVSITNQDDETASASLTTAIHNASHATVTTAAEGDLLHANAAVNGNGALTPTGDVTFEYFNNVTCTGTAAGSDTVTLDGSGTADMTASAALTADGLSFIARYAGDSIYPAADGACVSISTSQYPTVLVTSAGTIPADFANLPAGISSMQLQFNRDVMHDSNGNPGSVTNPANYLLVERGPNGILDTLSCFEGVGGDDRRLTVNTVSYDLATYRATVHINNGVQLTDGIYRLYVCGTTSILSADGGEYLNGHSSDSTIIFIVGTGNSNNGSSGSKKSVATGFTPGMVTRLPEQPAELAYNESDLWIEIPSLGIKQPIVGVPQTDAGWDVSWLGNDVGYLQGTAFPTWAGNSVLTGHVTGADGLPGVFANLGTLGWGDEIIIHAFGQKVVYEVRTVDLTASPDTSKVVNKHEDLPWLTLITCRGYDEKTDTYRYRTVVRAVQVSVEEE